VTVRECSLCNGELADFSGVGGAPADGAGARAARGGDATVQLSCKHCFHDQARLPDREPGGCPGAGLLLRVRQQRQRAAVSSATGQLAMQPLVASIDIFRHSMAPLCIGGFHLPLREHVPSVCRLVFDIQLDYGLDALSSCMRACSPLVCPGAARRRGGASAIAGPPAGRRPAL